MLAIHVINLSIQIFYYSFNIHPLVFISINNFCLNQLFLLQCPNDNLLIVRFLFHLFIGSMDLCYSIG